MYQTYLWSEVSSCQISQCHQGLKSLWPLVPIKGRGTDCRRRLWEVQLVSVESQETLELLHQLRNVELHKAHLFRYCSVSQ